MSVPESLLEADYRKNISRKLFYISGCLVALVMLVFLSLTHGAASIGAGEAFRMIFAPGKGDPFVRSVVWKIRMPRIMTALLAGAGLGMTGGVMQGILRNPLASPFTLGISSAAGFGASVAIVLGVGLAGAGQFLIVGNAFFFALGAFGLVYLLARSRGLTSETLILSGIAVMYLFSSLTSFLQYIATAEQLSTVVFWMMGSLSGATWIPVCVMGGTFLIASPILYRSAWDLNALSSGRETAVSLGIHVTRVTAVCMVLSALLTASIISFTGVIGFIGLVAPHITRMITGGDHRFLLPAASLGGAVLLLGADTLSRIIIPPSEIPLGIMTSLIGVPFFIYLLITRKRESFS